MKSSGDTWKKYWESRGKEAGGDYEADHRATHDNELEQIAERELIAFIDPQKNERVFDAGCGTGSNLSRLSPRVASVAGIDYSEQMVARAEKRIRAEGINNATVRTGSVTDSGMASDSFDKVVCISVMQYLDDDDCISALREFVRLTRNGGIIILHIKNLASLYLGSLYAAKKLKSLISGKVKIEYYRTQSWYERKLREVGAVPVAYDANHIFVVDFMPHRLYEWVVRTERKHYKSRFLRRYGSEYFIRARVEKGGKSGS